MALKKVTAAETSLFILVLIVTLNLVSGCDQVSISNARYQTSREGTYSRTTLTCAGRRVYRFGTHYLYFVAVTGGWRGWMVGSTVCSNVGGIAAEDEATTPDRVTSRWEEVNNGNWYYNSALRVQCTVGGGIVTTSTVSLSTGAIIGIVFGCFFLVVIVVVLVVCLCACNGKKTNTVTTHNNPNVRVVHTRPNGRTGRTQVFTTSGSGGGQYLGPANNTRMSGPRNPGPPPPGPMGPQPMHHGYGPMQPPPAYSAAPPAYPPPQPGNSSTVDPAYPPFTPPPSYTAKGYPANVSD